jgi:DNA invertase Pin-like site-specific DNA recombinase
MTPYDLCLLEDVNIIADKARLRECGTFWKFSMIFNNLGIEFVSLRENIDTDGPLGRAVVVIVGAIAELERSLIVERVRAGMRLAKLEGRRIGRALPTPRSQPSAQEGERSDDGLGDPDPPDRPHSD